mgnify:CR=1 FL=1|tara:strand:+ start:212 stop:1090 length:879 start_codon:yes stop_codon:yes gene_type:complete
MKAFFYDLKREFKKASIVHKLIYINVLIYIFTEILSVFSFMFQFDIRGLLNQFYLSANTSTLIKNPWSFFSYMFLHNGFFHLLFNMVWLHFGGKIFLQYLNSRQLLSTYIIGGFSGGALFILSYNTIPAFQSIAAEAYALGASASVFAIMVAIATYTPNYAVQFPFIGFLKLKHIAIFMVIIDVLSIPNGNAGGHIAHIGGAIFGYFYINRLQKGYDLSINISNLLIRTINTFKTQKKQEKVFKRSKSDYEFNNETVKKERKIDDILEKIASSGYESLSEEEKNILFSSSKK